MKIRSGFYLMVLHILSINFIAESQTTRDTSCTIYFRTNQHILDSGEVRKLVSFSQNAGEIVDVVGYADSTGASDYNLKLSKLRVQSVYAFLQKRGVKFVGAPRYAGELVLANADLQQSRKVDLTGHLTDGKADVRISSDHDHPCLGLIAKVSSADSLKTGRDTVEISLENIYFLPDRAVLSPESVPYVETLARSLLSYHGYNIQIIGHVNYQGTLRIKSGGLVALAERRAKLLFDLFAGYGLPESDMSYKGVANTQPAIADPKTYEEKRMNMRVQIFLIRKGQ